MPPRTSSPAQPAGPAPIKNRTRDMCIVQGRTRGNTHPFTQYVLIFYKFVIFLLHLFLNYTTSSFTDIFSFFSIAFAAFSSSFLILLFLISRASSAAFSFFFYILLSHPFSLSFSIPFSFFFYTFLLLFLYLLGT